MLTTENIGKCPICEGTEFVPGYNGRVHPGRTPPLCSGCKSAERHRIVHLMYQQLRPIIKDWRAFQFGPDGTLKKEWFASYEFSIYGGHLSYDMTNIDLPDGSYDLVASNHVIEHVSDDKKAVRECLRVVGESGVVHITAPAPGYRVQTEDWGFPDTSRAEHYREYGADMGRVLLSAKDGAKGIAVTGIDPVTLTADIVFFLSRSERTLFNITSALQRAYYPCLLL